MKWIVPIVALSVFEFSCSQKAAQKDLRTAQPSASRVDSSNLAGQSGLPSSPTPQAAQPPAQPPKIDAPPPPALSLDGTWESPCEVDPDTMTSNGFVEIYRGSDLTYMQLTLFYLDSKCTDLGRTVSIRSTYKMGKQSSRVPGAFEVDYNVTQVLVTPATDSIASALTEDAKTNGVAACVGYEYKANTPTDVSKCELTAPTYFDIVKLTGTQLQSGDCTAQGVCETAEKRATSLDNATRSRK